jgi:hypothetical protein
LRLHVPRGPKPTRLTVSYVDTCVLRGHDAYVACPTWTVLRGLRFACSTYVVTSTLTYEVKPLRGEKSYVDVDLRGHLSIDLRGQAPTWGKVLRGR